MKNIALITTCCFLMLISACKNKCSKIENLNSGLQNSEFRWGKCYLNANASTAGMIIKTPVEFSKYKADSLKFCDSTSVPSVDFNTSSLLGINAKGDGCNVGFERNLVKDTAAKKYIYTVNVMQCGDCGSRFLDPNWILTEKIATGYTVEFKIKYTDK